MVKPKSAEQQFVTQSRCSDHRVNFFSEMQNFSTHLSSIENDNIVSVILYGGLARDGALISGWSDIDLLLVFRDLTRINRDSICKQIRATELFLGIRLDCVFLADKDLWKFGSVVAYGHGAAINALLPDRNVGILVWGRFPELKVSVEQEKNIAAHYILQTLHAFRKYYFYDATDFNSEKSLLEHLPRLTRWCFSIIRAYLRLNGIFCHPYEKSLVELRKLGENVDYSLLETMCLQRKLYPNVTINGVLIHDLYQFVENFVECRAETIERHL